MKPFPLVRIEFGALLGATLIWFGCEVPQGTASEPITALPPVYTAPPGPDLVSVTNTTLAAPAPAPGETSTAMPAAETDAPPAPNPIQLSPRLQEIVKLAQSGVGDEVVLAYIQNSTTAFDPTPDEIVSLTDLGLSDVVVTALVQHHPAATMAPTAAPPPAVANAPPAVEVAPAATYNPEPPIVATSPSPVVYASPPVVDYNPVPVVENSYFFNSLSPYGTWVEVADYGWCWQPAAASLQPTWRPYCDHGRWLSTDCGWYWQSDYSWGWAPFHYGRWFHHPRRGWCWSPGSVWSPAWVSWRYSDAYCGWAPLPPGAYFGSGVGLTYYGAHVGASFTFGLGVDAWTFVPAGRLHDRDAWRYSLHGRDVASVYRHTRVVNSFAADHQHGVVNHGIDRERVPALAHTEVHKVAVRDLPERGGVLLRPDRIQQQGKDLVVYRPKPPANPALRPGDGANPKGPSPNRPPQTDRRNPGIATRSETSTLPPSSSVRTANEAGSARQGPATQVVAPRFAPSTSEPRTWTRPTPATAQPSGNLATSPAQGARPNPTYRTPATTSPTTPGTASRAWTAPTTARPATSTAAPSPSQVQPAPTPSRQAERVATPPASPVYRVPTAATASPTLRAQPSSEGSANALFQRAQPSTRVEPRQENLQVRTIQVDPAPRSTPPPPSQPVREAPSFRSFSPSVAPSSRPTYSAPARSMPSPTPMPAPVRVGPSPSPMPAPVRSSAPAAAPAASQRSAAPARSTSNQNDHTGSLR